MRVWKLYVDTKTLSNSSPLLDQLDMGDDDYDTDPDISGFILFGITTDKKKLKKFFELHRKEMFLVVSKKISKSDFEELKRTTEYNTCVMKDRDITIFIRVDKLIEPISYDTVLAEHEYTSIMGGHEMIDEFRYDLYDISDSLQYWYDELFTKELKKALDALDFRDTIEYTRAFYTDEFGAVPNVWHANEWALLADVYYEVLVGGEGANQYENPFI